MRLLLKNIFVVHRFPRRFLSRCALPTKNIIQNITDAVSSVIHWGSIRSLGYCAAGAGTGVRLPRRGLFLGLLSFRSALLLVLELL
jgi:hypothetical protein